MNFRKLTDHYNYSITGQHVPLDGHFTSTVQSEMCHRARKSMTGSVGHIECSIIATGTWLKQSSISNIFQKDFMNTFDTRENYLGQGIITICILE